MSCNSRYPLGAVDVLSPSWLMPDSVTLAYLLYTESFNDRSHFGNINGFARHCVLVYGIYAPSVYRMDA